MAGIHSYVGHLPQGWTALPVEDGCDKISLNGIKIKQKNYQSAGRYPVVDQGQDLIGGYFDEEEVVVPDEPPYVIFGDHTKVKKFINFRFIAGADGVKVLKPLGFYDPKLFYYFIHCIRIPDKGYARHFQFLEKASIPLPPLPEQHRIVEKIEALFSELDNGVQQLKTAQQQLNVYRQAVLKWAFEGKLTEEWRKQQPRPPTAETLLGRIKAERGEQAKASGKKLKPLAPLAEKELADLPLLPEGWSWEKLGNVIEEPKYGTSKKCDYDISGKGVLRIPNIGEGVIDNSDLKHAEFDAKEIETYRLESGDLLIIRSNGSVDLVGKCALITGQDEKYLFAGYLIRLRPSKNTVNSKYLLNNLVSHELRNQIESKAKSTSGVNNINSDELKGLIIPVCSLKEQLQIVQEIESRLSVCDKLEEIITESLQQAEALRQSILKKAFEGKLVPQDPKDLPASELLNQIKEEKRARENIL